MVLSVLPFLFCFAVISFTHSTASFIAHYSISRSTEHIVPLPIESRSLGVETSPRFLMTTNTQTITIVDGTLASMEFVWDEDKAATNRAKHGVSFEDAKTVFYDPLYIDFYDPDHSDEENRYIIVRESRAGRLLIVAYTERDDLIRLISAREATQGEREAYEEHENKNER